MHESATKTQFDDPSSSIYMSLVDFMIDELLNYNEAQEVDTQADPSNVYGLPNLSFPVNRAIGHLKILESKSMLDDMKFILNEDDCREIYEGGPSITAGSVNNPIELDNESMGTLDTNAIRYSVAGLERPQNLEDDSSISLDIDSFLAIPDSLAVAKWGIKVSEISVIYYQT